MNRVVVACVVVALAAAVGGCTAWDTTDESEQAVPRPLGQDIDLHAASHNTGEPTSTDTGLGCSACQDGPVLRRPERVPLAKDRFVVYLFHSERACDCGQAVAAGAGKAISENFASRVRSGTLECIALNVQDEANAHYADKYKLTPVDHLHNGLVVVEFKDNQPGRWKKLDRADELKDSDKFPAYVAKEIEAFIKGSAGSK